MDWVGVGVIGRLVAVAAVVAAVVAVAAAVVVVVVVMVVVVIVGVGCSTSTDNSITAACKIATATLSHCPYRILFVYFLLDSDTQISSPLLLSPPLLISPSPPLLLSSSPPSPPLTRTTRLLQPVFVPQILFAGFFIKITQVSLIYSQHPILLLVLVLVLILVLVLVSLISYPL